MTNPVPALREMGNALMILLGLEQKWEAVQVQLLDPEFTNKLHLIRHNTL